jgi:hypothetical protein
MPRRRVGSLFGFTSRSKNATRRWAMGAADHRLTSFSRVSASQACGSTSLSVAGSISEATQAQLAAPWSLPAKRAILRLRALGQHAALDGVGIDLDAAVIEIADKPVPMIEAVAKGGGNDRFGGVAGELRLEPALELGDDRRGLGLADGPPRCGL